MLACYEGALSIAHVLLISYHTRPECNNAWRHMVSHVAEVKLFPLPFFSPFFSNSHASSFQFHGTQTLLIFITRLTFMQLALDRKRSGS